MRGAYRLHESTKNMSARMLYMEGDMFKKAVKYGARLRMGLAGPSKSGKTYSALRIGRALVGPEGRIAAIDTERGTMSLYANEFDFDVLELEPPYHPQRYIDAIKQAEEGGYDLLIIDSLSHAWVGAGGALELKTQYAQRREYSDYTAWGPVGELQNKLVDAIVSANMHVIATMRSKTKYSMEKEESDGKSRTVVKKLGMEPIQRDGLEYEFDIFGDMDWQHNLVIDGNSRCTELNDTHAGVYHNPGEEVAEIIARWLAGEDAPAKPVSKERVAMNARVEVLLAEARKLGVELWDNPDEVADFISGQYGAASMDDLSDKQLIEMGKLLALDVSTAKEALEESD